MVKPKLENTPPNADLTGEPLSTKGHDITPQITYGSDGRATQIKIFYFWNSDGVNSHTCRLDANGRYLEESRHHFGPVVVGEREVSLSRLEEQDRAHPNKIPKAEILGRTRAEVKALLTERGMSAYHLAAA